MQLQKEVLKEIIAKMPFFKVEFSHKLVSETLASMKRF